MTKQWLHSADTKIAFNPATGKIVTGFCQHTSFIDHNYDQWVRGIVFPQRKRVYFRFYKPDGDYYFVNDDDRAKSFDVCYSAWQRLIAEGYCQEDWKPLFAATDNVITELDIKF